MWTSLCYKFEAVFFNIFAVYGDVHNKFPSWKIAQVKNCTLLYIIYLQGEMLGLSLAHTYTCMCIWKSEFKLAAPVFPVILLVVEHTVCWYLAKNAISLWNYYYIFINIATHRFHFNYITSNNSNNAYLCTTFVDYLFIACKIWDVMRIYKINYDCINLGVTEKICQGKFLVLPGLMIKHVKLFMIVIILMMIIIHRRNLTIWKVFEKLY